MKSFTNILDLTTANSHSKAPESFFNPERELMVERERRVMKTFIVAGVVAIAVVASSARAQTTIAQWNYESVSDSNIIVSGATPGAGNASASVPADVGTGSANGLHATAATYSVPAGDLDPNIAALSSGAIQADTSPSTHCISANNWSVGDYWQFTTSTLGFTGVEVAWDQTGSNTGPGNFSLYYSTGAGFNLLSGPYTVGDNTGSTLWNTTTAQPASIIVSGGGVLDNAATVSLRLVDDSTTDVIGGTVATAGADRVDNFTVVGVPEPSTIALVGSGLAAGLFGMRRRRS